MKHRAECGPETKRKRVKLETRVACRDGGVFSISSEVVAMCGVIKEFESGVMFESGAEESIPVSVSSASMCQIVDFCEGTIDINFFREMVETSEFLDVLRASNLLDVATLRSCMLDVVAEAMKNCTSRQHMRDSFHITDDFHPSNATGLAVVAQHSYWTEFLPKVSFHTLRILASTCAYFEDLLRIEALRGSLLSALENKNFVSWMDNSAEVAVAQLCSNEIRNERKCTSMYGLIASVMLSRSLMQDPTVDLNHLPRCTDAQHKRAVMVFSARVIRRMLVQQPSWTFSEGVLTLHETECSVEYPYCTLRGEYQRMLIDPVSCLRPFLMRPGFITRVILLSYIDFTDTIEMHNVSVEVLKKKFLEIFTKSKKKGRRRHGHSAVVPDATQGQDGHSLCVEGYRYQAQTGCV